MYTSFRVGQLRHEEMLQRAEKDRQVRHLRSLSRASKRVERARRRLSQAQRHARRVSRELGQSWG